MLYNNITYSIIIHYSSRPKAPGAVAARARSVPCI